MSATEIRADIDNFLDIVQQDDEGLLKAVHALLSTYMRERVDPILGYDADGHALRVSEAKKRFKAELEGVKRGEYLTIEDFEKKSESW